MTCLFVFAGEIFFPAAIFSFTEFGDFLVSFF